MVPSIVAKPSQLFFATLLCYYLLISSLAVARNLPRESCGYESCHRTKPGLLNIHIVCHTHLDTGWVETYEEYYHRYVRMIYDSVVNTLYDKPTRKFIVVETSFFSKWFNDQSETIKDRVRWLVREGQLEFINGGWSMNDEASVYYQDVIDQFTLGHQWLNLTFGQCAHPKIGWQVDPFGHSREQASLFSQMAFDGLFLGRIDYQDKKVREQSRTLEMVWKSSPSLGPKADIFTGVLPNVYWPPTGFCWDMNCYDSELHDLNQVQKARQFIRQMRQQAYKYQSNHTIVTMGMDFYFRDAAKWYRNLDRLIDTVNSLEAQEGVHMMYSTPSCYLQALHESNRQWPVKLDDFFPYADAFNTYWTGYFTSRPSLKYHIRQANSLLQTAKQLHVLSGMDSRQAQKLRPLQEALGILQHHDAVTGTCKQYVADDYNNMLTKASLVAEESISDSLGKIWTQQGLAGPYLTGIHFCHELNVSACALTENLGRGIPNRLLVILYNPIAHAVKHYVRLPIKGGSYRVRDSTATETPSQIVPNHEAVRALPSKTRSPADSELVFRTVLPPLGFTTLAVERTEPNVMPPPNQLSRIVDGQQLSSEAVITNGRISAVFDSNTGLLASVTLRDGRRIPLKQNFYIYDAEGRKSGEKPSGAYAFNPNGDKPRAAATFATIKVIKGPLVEEVHQTFTPWISQVIRIYQHVDYIEFDWVVGPIQIDNYFFDPGQEVISKFETPMQTNRTFFTDANGRETLRRTRDQRPTWDLDTTEKVASNYYPVTSWVFIRDYDKDVQLTILPDRPQGASSLDGSNEGLSSIEMMVHRRLTLDDGFGMDEALNEPGEDGRGLIARGKHRVIVGDIKESVRQMRMASKTLSMKPLMSLMPGSRPLNPNQPGGPGQLPQALENSRFIGLNRKLPANVHLLTLEPWHDSRVLIRLEHLFEVNEDAKYSKPRRISVRDLFAPFIVVGVEEMTLSANRIKQQAERTRMRWMPEMDPYANYTNVLTQLDSEDLEMANTHSSANAGNPFYVTLYPMDIKTFLVSTVERKDCPYSGIDMPRRGGRHRIPNC